MGFVFVAHLKRTWKCCTVNHHEGWTLVDCAFAQSLVIGLERILAIIVHWAQHHSCLDFKLRSSLYNCFLIFPIISYQFQFFLQLGQISNKLHELQMLLPFVCKNNFVCKKNNKQTHKHKQTHTTQHLIHTNYGRWWTRIYVPMKCPQANLSLVKLDKWTLWPYSSVISMCFSLSYDKCILAPTFEPLKS